MNSPEEQEGAGARRDWQFPARPGLRGSGAAIGLSAYTPTVGRLCDRAQKELMPQGLSMEVPSTFGAMPKDGSGVRVEAGKQLQR
jgi:hypothetical protein